MTTKINSYNNTTNYKLNIDSKKRDGEEEHENAMNLKDLPPEVLSLIFNFLDSRSIPSIHGTCQAFRELTADQTAALSLKRSIVSLDYPAVREILDHENLMIADDQVNPRLKRLIVKMTISGLKKIAPSEHRKAWNQKLTHVLDPIEYKKWLIAKALVTDSRFTDLLRDEPDLLPLPVDELFLYAAINRDEGLLKNLASNFAIPSGLVALRIYYELRNNVEGIKILLQTSISSEDLVQMASTICEYSNNPEILKMILSHPNWDPSSNKLGAEQALLNSWQPVKEEFIQILLDHGRLDLDSIDRAFALIAEDSRHFGLPAALNMLLLLPSSIILNTLRGNPLLLRTIIEHSVNSHDLIYHLLGTAEGIEYLCEVTKNEPDLIIPFLYLSPSVLITGVEKILYSAYKAIHPELAKLALHPEKVVLCTVLTTAAISDFSSKLHQ